MRRALLSFVILAGCYRPSPERGIACAQPDICPQGLTCIDGFCGGGGIDASIEFDACPATSCTNSQLEDCNGSHACTYGCGSGAPHCLSLVPSNGVTPALLGGANASVAGGALAFDTDTGAITANGNPLRAAGAGVNAGISFAILDGMGVFGAHRFAVPASTLWTGHGTNALVLYASDTIDVAGVIDVGATAASPGPSGATGGTGGPPTTCFGSNGGYKTALSAGAGGGGAGGATVGGRGADTAADVNGSTAGGAGGATVHCRRRSRYVAEARAAPAVPRTTSCVAVSAAVAVVRSRSWR